MEVIERSIKNLMSKSKRGKINIKLTADGFALNVFDKKVRKSFIARLLYVHQKLIMVIFYPTLVWKNQLNFRLSNKKL